VLGRRSIVKALSKGFNEMQVFPSPRDVNANKRICFALA